MRVLVTGGTGTTGRRVAARLEAVGHKAYTASRTPRADADVRFDWHDPETFCAFDGIDGVYLVAPSGTSQVLETMAAGLEHALSAGVRRFALLSASSIEEGGPMMGEVHSFLRRQASEWAVLRPSWFMQNFTEGQHRRTILDEGVIYSATGTGAVPLIDAADIAAVAARLLTVPDALNSDVVITGPELLTYDDVAAIVSGIMGRTVIHRKLTPAQMAERFRAAGLDYAYAQTLAGMDEAIAHGKGGDVTNAVEKFTGNTPTSFREVAHRTLSDLSPARD